MGRTGGGWLTTRRRSSGRFTLVFNSPTRFYRTTATARLYRSILSRHSADISSRFQSMPVIDTVYCSLLSLFFVCFWFFCFDSNSKHLCYFIRVPWKLVPHAILFSNMLSDIPLSLPRSVSLWSSGQMVFFFPDEAKTRSSIKRLRIVLKQTQFRVFQTLRIFDYIRYFFLFLHFSVARSWHVISL